MNLTSATKRRMERQLFSRARAPNPTLAKSGTGKSLLVICAELFASVSVVFACPQPNLPAQAGAGGIYKTTSRRGDKPQRMRQDREEQVSG